MDGYDDSDIILSLLTYGLSFLFTKLDDSIVEKEMSKLGKAA